MMLRKLPVAFWRKIFQLKYFDQELPPRKLAANPKSD